MASSFEAQALDAPASASAESVIRANGTIQAPTPNATAGANLDPPVSPTLIEDLNYDNHRQKHDPSKLPAFRYTDLQVEPFALPSLPYAGKHYNTSSTPVSREGETQPDTTREKPPQPRQHNQYNNSRDKPQAAETVSPEDDQSSAAASSPRDSADRSRSPTLQNTSTPAIPATQSTGDSNRSTFLDPSSIPASRLHAKRRASNISRQSSVESIDDVTKEWAQGQRELLLPKVVQRTAANEKRHSVSRRPPLSYKPPPASAMNTTGGIAAVPPIRSLRSSGPRRGLALDMSNVHSARGHDSGDDTSDTAHHDRTLRTLEGRRDSDLTRTPPPRSAIPRGDFDQDDHGDVFLQMAREEPETRVPQSARTHRRPLSAAIPLMRRPSSPPQFVRRMSEQDTAKARHGDEAERLARTLAQKLAQRERSSDETRSRSSSILKPSPTFASSIDSGHASKRRRPSLTDGGSSHPIRIPTLKHSSLSNVSNGRSYNSSPLISKPMHSERHDPHLGEHHGLEGTDSSASTAAPSSVWDELDDLKSRIHRLELTGKLPPTSGAAISRASDDRPPTATTAATTMSASPKQASTSGDQGGAQQTDATSTVSTSLRDSQPMLQSALNKTKTLLAPDVYSALETAAEDAIALSNMIGSAGQPGPISSGASNLAGSATVTDRQLRRKVKSVCLSLTELCLALSENTSQPKDKQISDVQATEKENTAPMSPTVRFTFIPTQPPPRRSSTFNSAALSSPRAMSRLQEKRNNMLMSSALPTPSRIFANIPMPSIETATSSATTPTANLRRSSLMVSRGRRAETEEPEEQQQQQSGRRSSLLRTRRAGTEEPTTPGRKTALYLRRSNREDADEEEGEHRFRVPSRAVTEVATSRTGVSREYHSHMPLSATETVPMSPSLSRRHLAPSEFATRIGQPSVTTTGFGTRKYSEKVVIDRDNVSGADKRAEERGQRQFALSSGVSRSSSIKRAKRDSMITNASTTATAGSYR